MDSGNGIAPSQRSLCEYLLAAVPVSSCSCMIISLSIFPNYHVIFVFLRILLFLIHTYWLYLSASISLSLPFFLALHGIHSLYATILKIPVILHTIKEIPLFCEDSISHELVCLFHGITRAQRHLHTMERPLEDSHIPLHMNLAELPRHVLAALHLHGFGTFISMLPPETIYPTFRQIFFSFSQAECNSYLECLEHASMPLP